MEVQLVYGTDDIRARYWSFVPSVGDIIWDGITNGQIHRVAERHVAVNFQGRIDRVSLILEKG